MSEFFKKMMYGDGNKKDFSPSDYPKTRPQVYKRLVAKQLGKLLCANLWTLLFCLPFLAWNILCLSYGSTFDGATAEGKQAYLRFLVTVRYPLCVVFGVVCFVGFSGLTQTVRKLCWGLPVRTTREYFRGVKNGGVQFAVVGLVASVLYCLFDLAFAVLQYSAFDAPQRILLYALASFAAILLCCGLMFLLNLCSTYRISLFVAVKNSFLLAIKYVWKTVGILCVTLLPVAVLSVLGNIWTELAAALVLGVFGFVHIAVVWHLFTNGIFDNHINKQNYREFYRMGLSPDSAPASGAPANGGNKSDVGTVTEQGATEFAEQTADDDSTAADNTQNHADSDLSECQADDGAPNSRQTSDVDEVK